jgi:hypothetical protein
MVAESKISNRETKRSILSLAGNGSNVKAWECAVHSALQTQGMICLLMADYGMHVSSDKTLALDLKMRVDRAIHTGRAEVVTRARFVAAEAAVAKSEATLAKSRKMKAEERLEAKNIMPKLEPVEVEETKEQVEVHEVASSTKETKEQKMRARAAVIAERMNTHALTTERRGAQHTVFYLDPLTGLALDDEDDPDVACHVVTLHGETMRYAVESPQDAQLRMKLDALIVDSLIAIPPHITTGVLPGNIHDRFKRVVLFFDDVGRKALIAEIDENLGTICKRTRESFAAFTSRFKDIERRMDEQDMVIDPQLMLSKLEHALTSSADEEVKITLRQVKLAIGLPTSTTDELLASMAEPMRDREKDHKATQDKSVKAEQQRVNALYQSGGGRGQGGKGRGGKGKGGRGAKGGNKSKTACLKFAEGRCTYGDQCHFKHVALDAKEIAELKAKLAAAKAAKAPPNNAKGYTTAHVVNALQTSSAQKTTEKKLTLTEKMDELRKEGLSDDHILKVATLLLSEK